MDIVDKNQIEGVRNMFLLVSFKYNSDFTQMIHKIK